MSTTIVKAFDEGESGRNEYRAPAAEKALDILELMADQAEGLTQTEIANGLGRSIHEIYRILLLLEKRGYIIRTQSDRFRLSLRLFELAHRHPPVNRLVECALPVMRELAANADQSCHLIVREGQNVLVVLQIDSPLPMRYSVALGSHFPMLETSSGAVLLAHLDGAERDLIIERIVAAGEGQGRQRFVARFLQIDATHDPVLLSSPDAFGIHNVLSRMRPARCRRRRRRDIGIRSRRHSQPYLSRDQVG